MPKTEATRPRRKLRVYSASEVRARNEAKLLRKQLAELRESIQGLPSMETLRATRSADLTPKQRQEMDAAEVARKELDRDEARERGGTQSASGSPLRSILKSPKRRVKIAQLGGGQAGSTRGSPTRAPTVPSTPNRNG